MKRAGVSSHFIAIIYALLFSFNASAFDDTHKNFLQCLYNNNSTSLSKLVYTKTNSSYSSILQFSLQNLRFSYNSTPKPLVIVTPLQPSHVQATVICSQLHGLQIRIRSGGHDYEGLSYVSQIPFVIIDFVNYRKIQVDVENRAAWVQVGATVGELYYSIGTKTKTLAVTAGACTTVGVGGQFSGGGYGSLIRKYGLSADNIIDAHIIDVKGRFLDREGMGEDLFWAIRGGGGASFGVILAWKIKLVPVPSTVTLLRAPRTLEQNATKLVHKWQSVASRLDNNIVLGLLLQTVNSSINKGELTVQALFNGLFLGGVDKLLPLVQESFPELGLAKEDCTEMSWIESTLYSSGSGGQQPLEVLLNRSQVNTDSFKAKSDIITDPIPESGLEGLWRLMFEDEAKDLVLVIFPFGGRMSEIPESEIPFPHRAGVLYQIQYSLHWQEKGEEVAQRRINWMRKLYSYMEPFVSKSPRKAYINYRDLDIGVNNIHGNTSYEQASIWGHKYFNNNFKRLAYVKTKVDPLNFFRFEQSIPTLI
ncbi:tetrahydroberberine oxidase-like [Arachis stenosperma]|uniref:tetrahydroberberine oxidase-like n=1 Tax=Arachis stenosperma TaxID=217475 RepID=UPI0025ABEEC7|nr:tetrahydroberberine oxidase-like [Arachis stenosperma]